jgi:DNA-binding XRE family transcriptional regulator
MTTNPLPAIAIETIADTEQQLQDAAQTIADLQIPVTPTNVVPNNGFMIDQDGNRIGSIYTTPRACIRCGTMFIPPKQWKRSIAMTCSEPCRRRYAVRQITAIGQEAAARKREILPARQLFAVDVPKETTKRPKSPPTNERPPLVGSTHALLQERRSNGQFGKASRPPIEITRKDAHQPEAAFGRSLRRRRLAAGLTMTHLGELMGRHRNAVNNWERNAVTIPADMLAQLAQILDCTMEELWYDR